MKEGESAVEDPSPAAELLERKETPRKTAASSTYGIKVEGVDDVMLRLAKCCRPVPGDPIVGYISLGKGITIHHDSCPNAKALKKNPERFASVEWEGDTTSSFRVELQIDGWDRHRLLEDLSRTFAETGINILEARCTVVHPMVKNRFVVEVGGHVVAQDLHHADPEHRVRVRRVSRDADGLMPERRGALSTCHSHSAARPSMSATRGR